MNTSLKPYLPLPEGSYCLHCLKDHPFGYDAEEICDRCGDYAPTTTECTFTEGIITPKCIAHHAAPIALSSADSGLIPSENVIQNKRIPYGGVKNLASGVNIILRQMVGIACCVKMRECSLQSDSDKDVLKFDFLPPGTRVVTVGIQALNPNYTSVLAGWEDVNQAASLSDAKQYILSNIDALKSVFGSIEDAPCVLFQCRGGRFRSQLIAVVYVIWKQFRGSATLQDVIGVMELHHSHRPFSVTFHAQLSQFAEFICYDVQPFLKQ